MSTPGPARTPLVAARWRRPVAVVVALGAILLIALAVAVHGRRSTRFDSHVLAWLFTHVTGQWVRITIDASIPATSVALLAAVLIVALLTGRYSLAMLAVAGPAVGIGLGEYVLKPLVGRHYGTGNRPDVLDTLAYPSGHETVVATTALVLLFATCALSSRATVRTFVALVVTIWTVVAGVGLVVNFWHYATDVIGAVALSVAVVLGFALLLDRLFGT